MTPPSDRDPLPPAAVPAVPAAAPAASSIDLDAPSSPDGHDAGHDDDGEGDDDEEDDGDSLVRAFAMVALMLGAMLLIQQFVVKPFKIPSGSMENTLRCDDRLVVERIGYRFSDPKRHDVVVFNPPAAIGPDGSADPMQIADEASREAMDDPDAVADVSAKVDYIKRIIGMPGDEVEVRNHRVFINGKLSKEPFVAPRDEEDDDSELSDWGPKTVPQGTYLMLGDNRANSLDGRAFGFVKREFIVGKAVGIYWPPKHIGGLPGRDGGGAPSSEPDPNCDGV